MKEESIRVSGRQIELPMLITASRVQSNVASRVAWHSHEGFEILYLLDGATAYEFSGQKTVDLHGGEFLVVPPGLIHRGVHDVRSPCRICGLSLKRRIADWKNSTFTISNLVLLRKALESPCLRAHPFSPEMRWLLRRLMEATTTCAKNPGRPEAAIALRTTICGVLVESMRQILVPPAEPKLFVSAAISYLRKHLQEPITTKDLVRFVGFGRARLFDMFKAQTGLTPKDYLQRLRIEKAQEQLLATNQTVTDIALSLGFKSGQYFSTVFSRYTGVAPTEFRKGAKARLVSVPRNSII